MLTRIIKKTIFMLAMCLSAGSLVYSQSIDDFSGLGCLNEDLETAFTLAENIPQDSLPGGVDLSTFTVTGDCDDATILIGGFIPFMQIVREDSCNLSMNTITPIGDTPTTDTTINICEVPTPVAQVMSAVQHPRVLNFKGSLDILMPRVLPGHSFIKITVYDVTGLKLWTENINLESSSPGSISWNGTDVSGTRVSAGVYFLQIEMADFIWQVKSWFYP